jgi:hypothetical protein
MVAHRHAGMRLVSIRDLPDIKRPPERGSPGGRGPATTAALRPRGRPDPDRPLPGGLRITTRCEHGCCVDGLMAGDRVLLAAAVGAGQRSTCRHGWLERVVRVAYQDETAVSIYVAESSYDDGAAHANNLLRCRTFDLATGHRMMLHDVLPGAQSGKALAAVRRRLRDSIDFSRFTANTTGIRLRKDADGRRHVQLCSEGFYPGESESIVEIDAR